MLIISSTEHPNKRKREAEGWEKRHIKQWGEPEQPVLQ